MTEAAPADTEARGVRSRPRGIARLAGAVALLLVLWQGARLFRLIDRVSVDVPYWDQWDFYDPFFRSAGWWGVFSHQHGPHRQGVGGLLIWATNELTGWNQRAQCFVIGTVLVLSVLLALGLKRRLLGGLDALDAMPALMILAPRQWALFAVAPNVAHGAAPLALLLASCLAWTIPSTAKRYGAVLLLDLLAIFTGFGFFLGVLTPVLLAVDLGLALGARDRRGGRLAAAALLVSILGVLSFFRGYRFDIVTAGVPLADSSAPLYPVYVAAMFAKLFGLDALGIWGLLLGFGITALVVVAMAATLRDLVRRRDALGTGRAAFLLLGFSLVFCASAAVGRIKVAGDVAAASRYFPLLVPAAIAFHILVRGLQGTVARRVGTAVLLTLTFLAAGPPDVVRSAEFFRAGKTAWVLAYRAAGDTAEADARANFVIHPYPDKTRLEEKLSWLKARGYSLFRPDGPDSPRR